MSDQPNFQRISGHLQTQRNSFADAHAVAAARGDELADENARLLTALADANRRIDQKDARIAVLEAAPAPAVRKKR